MLSIIFLYRIIGEEKKYYAEIYIYRGSLFACLFCMVRMYFTLKYSFYILFHLCALNSVFWKFLRFFLDLKFDIFHPLNTNNKILVLHLFKGEKCQTSKQEKIGKNSLLVLFLGKMHNMKQCTTFNNFFFTKCRQFGTLYYILYMA